MEPDQENSQKINSLWNIFSRINTTKEIEQAYLQHKSVTFTSGLTEILHSLGKLFNYNLDQAYPYFKPEINKFDENDRINPYNIDISAFVLRLGNFVLEIIYKMGKFDKNLTDFIKDARKNDENVRKSKESVDVRSSKELRQYKSKKTIEGKSYERNEEKNKQESLEEHEIENEIFDTELRNSVDLKHDNIEDTPLLGSVSKKVIDEFREKNKHELDSDSEEHKSGLEKTSDGKWSVQQFKHHEKRIREIFSEFDKNKGKVKVTEIVKLFLNIVNELNLQVHDHQRLLFSKMVENFAATKPEKKTEKNKKKSHYKINFEELSEIFHIWGKKFNEDKEKIEGKVIQTIQDLEELKFELEDFGTLSKIVNSLKTSVHSVLSSYLNTHKEEHRIQKTIKKNIEEVFLFYGKAQKIQGAVDTFEGLESSNTNWNLGKFLKFSLDFGLLQTKSESERGLSKDQLSVIFKKTATNSRLMTEAQFLDSLDKIAEVFYSIYFDNLLGSGFAPLSLAEKRKMLYAALGFDKPNSYHSRVKSFAAPHTPVEQIKLPKSSLLHKGEYKMPENMAKKIEEWKEKKIKILNSTPPTLRPNLIMPNRKYSDSRKSTNDLPTGELGYAKRMKKREAKKEIEENRSVIEKEENFIEKPEEKQKIKGATNIITIKALNELELQDFDSDNELKQLISDEKDEYFDKFYEINPKLKGIMKMHEVKLAKGQKVLDKINKL